jgi:hypothetical protein
MSLDSTPATTPKSGSNLIFGFNVPAASGSSSSAGAPAVPDFTFAKPDAVKTSPSTAALDPGTGVFNLGATPKPKAAAKPAPAIDGTGSRKARAAPTKTRGKRGRDDDEDADRSTPSADGAAVNLGSAQPPPDASSEQQAPVDNHNHNHSHNHNHNHNHNHKPQTTTTTTATSQQDRWTREEAAGVASQGYPVGARVLRITVLTEGRRTSGTEVEWVWWLLIREFHGPEAKYLCA